MDAKGRCDGTLKQMRERTRTRPAVLWVSRIGEGRPFMEPAYASVGALRRILCVFGGLEGGRLDIRVCGGHGCAASY